MNGEMNYTATVVSSLTFVGELERSVNHYQKLFACILAFRQDNGPLLLAPDGMRVVIARPSPQQ